MPGPGPMEGLGILPDVELNEILALDELAQTNPQ